jgi:hypothetical protein
MQKKLENAVRRRILGHMSWLIHCLTQDLPTSSLHQMAAASRGMVTIKEAFHERSDPG